jgi:hypothetical protein
MTRRFCCPHAAGRRTSNRVGNASHIAPSESKVLYHHYGEIVLQIAGGIRATEQINSAIVLISDSSLLLSDRVIVVHPLSPLPMHRFAPSVVSSNFK